MKKINTNIEHQGGCLCGAVRYLATGEPLIHVNCHCPSCRRAVGAPMVAWVDFATKRFSWTTAEPRVYRSSSRLRRTFCGTCGTSLTNQNAENATVVSVSLASMDEDQDLMPDCHIWASKKLAWVELGERTHAHDEAEP